MQKKLTAVAIAGAVVLGGGAAVAVPAFAADSNSSSTAAPAPATTSRADAIKQALKGLVDDKTLTQAQADKVADTLGKPGALPGGGHGGLGGGGVRGGFMQEEADAAAKVLGMSADDIRTALRDGTTLAELAKKQNKSETDLINALVDVAKTRLATAVKDDRLTQARADEIQKNLPDQVKNMVENGRPAFGKGMRGGGGPDGRGWGRGENGTPPSPGATPGQSSAPSPSASAASFEPATSI